MYRYVELVKDNKRDVNTTSHLPIQIWPDISCKIDRDLLLLSETGNIDRQMFPSPWKYAEEKRKSENYKKNDIHRLSPSSTQTSKRPVTCPYMDCQKAIAISSLPNHFLYEHKSVPYLHTTIGSSIGIELCLQEIKYNSITCIMLINVLESPVVSLEENTTIKPALLLMAVKLPSFSKGSNNDKEDDEQSMLTESSHSINCSPIDKILIWLASNMPLDYSYTLCATASDASRRSKYFGPVTTLDEKYTKLCEECKGLVLTQNHINGLSLQGRHPIVLDVIVHE